MQLWRQGGQQGRTPVQLMQRRVLRLLTETRGLRHFRLVPPATAQRWLEQTWRTEQLRRRQQEVQRLGRMLLRRVLVAPLRHRRQTTLGQQADKPLQGTTRSLPTRTRRLRG